LNILLPHLVLTDWVSVCHISCWWCHVC